MKQYTEPKFSMTSFDIEDIMVASGTGSVQSLDDFANKTKNEEHILSIPFSSLTDLSE